MKMERESSFMKKMTLISGLVLTSLIALSGCNNKKEEKTSEEEIVVNYSEEGNMATVTDSFNRKVTYDKTKTSRVVCLGAGALRIYSYVGDIDKLVGVEQIDKEPFGVGTALRPYYDVNKDFFATLPIVGQGGPQAQAPEYEKLVDVNPDIIVSIYSSVETNNEITEKTNIPVIGIKQGGDAFFASEFKFSLKLLGKVFNKEEKADALISYLNKSKEDLAKRREGVKKVNAYAGCIGNWGRTNAYGTIANFPVFNYAGVNNVGDLLKGDASSQFTIDAEKLIEANPEHIYLDGAGLTGFLDDYKINKNKYDVLDAFKNDEVYLLLPYNAYYTNIEIGLMSTYYVGLTSYPEKFKDIKIEDKCNEILKAFLGKGSYKDLLEYSTAYDGYGKLNLSELTK